LRGGPEKKTLMKIMTGKRGGGNRVSETNQEKEEGTTQPKRGKDWRNSVRRLPIGLRVKSLGREKNLTGSL